MPDLVSQLSAALSDHYKIERELGQGGMATVYLARDLKHNRMVAVKVLNPELSATMGAQRFLKEIETVAQLNHPHILPLHDSGRIQDILFYVMPYVEGESLRDRLNRERQLPIDEAIEITKEVADALSYAHAKGVVHRDIKPENILLQDGHALVADFGIARAMTEAGATRMTETGLAVGTPAYMSPEQAMGDDVDGRADTYALACVTYEMLAGTPPFTGPTVQAILSRHASDPVPPLKTLRDTVSEHMEAVVKKALAKAPADRFRASTEFATALSSSAQSRGPKTRAKRLAVAGVAAAVLAVAALVVWRGRSAQQEIVALDPRTIAVMPFRVTGADTSLAYLRGGMVEAFHLALTGDEGSPRASDPSTVLELWRRQVGDEDRELPDTAAREIARRVGAGLLLTGAIIGDAERLTISGVLQRVATGDRFQESVTGPLDSLLQMTRRLAGWLVFSERGEGDSWFSWSRLPNTPLPALKEFLVAFDIPGGRIAMVEHLARALDYDSTFAAAALNVFNLTTIACFTPFCEEQRARGQRLAFKYRDRLSERDRVYLMAMLGPNYPHESSTAERIAALEAAIDVAPDVPALYENRWGLAYLLRQRGEYIGLADWREKAARAVDRAVELTGGDSLGNGTHLEIELFVGDSSRVPVAARRYLAAADSANPNMGTFEWLAYRALNDTIGLARLRAHPSEPWCRPGYVGYFSILLGFPLEDFEFCITQAEARAVTAAERMAAVRQWLPPAIIRGRPSEGTMLADSVRRAGFDDDDRLLVWPIEQALTDRGYDSSAARSAAVLDSIQRLPPNAKPLDTAWNNDFYRICYAELWRVRFRQDTSNTGAAVARLRELMPEPRYNNCGPLLEALVEAIDTTRATTTYLNRVDSLMRSGPYGNMNNVANFVIAQLYEANGELELALAALRRRQNMIGMAEHLPAYLREEGRVAELCGDVEGAIVAYDWYLTLRSNPELGPVQEEVDSVRAALARLVGERSNRRSR